MPLPKNTISLCTTYRIDEVQLASNRHQGQADQSYIFTLQALGNYSDMIAFASELSQLDRIITVESMEIGRDSQTNALTLHSERETIL